ncbi:MAG TPA: hypothetical protein VIO61_01430 [Anaerolineaceae bacterium]
MEASLGRELAELYALVEKYVPFLPHPALTKRSAAVNAAEQSPKKN